VARNCLLANTPPEHPLSRRLRADPFSVGRGPKSVKFNTKSAERLDFGGLWTCTLFRHPRRASFRSAASGADPWCTLVCYTGAFCLHSVRYRCFSVLISLVHTGEVPSFYRSLVTLVACFTRRGAPPNSHPTPPATTRPSPPLTAPTCLGLCAA
jgi:hypothetical protein